MSEQPTLQAVRACADWLKACLDLGWCKADLDFLEALWWKYHDRCGHLLPLSAEAPTQEPTSSR